MHYEIVYCTDDEEDQRLWDQDDHTARTLRDSSDFEELSADYTKQQ